MCIKYPFNAKRQDYKITSIADEHVILRNEYVVIVYGNVEYETKI